MCVLYIVPRFPNIRTTFIAHEMAELRNLGAEIFVATGWSSRTAPHLVEEPFMDHLVPLRLTNPLLWLLALWQLIRHPNIIPLLVELFIGHLLSIYALLKFFANAPKGLYLGWWVHHNNIEHIHAQFLTTPATIAVIASKISGIPYSTTGHAFDIFATSPQLINGGLKTKCKHAAFNVMISNYNLQHMKQKQIPGRFELIYNGIDTTLFPHPHPETILTHHLVRLLAVGSLIEKKGHYILIEAVKTLSERDISVELSIIGGGPLEDDLRAKAGDNVQFLGTMPQEKVVENYASCDIVVLACVVAANGDMDGLPTTLIEALAMELPAISTDISGIPEVIINGETGLYVETGKSAALADAIQWMIEHPDEARRMGQRGRELVLERFDRRKNARRLYDLIQEGH
ncbi:MAG: glycosyltransferase family 4 protein [Chloroflexi bacterium]|nr:glycosyltransferase family 4 protein [Chloroflexota bacterium]